MPSSKCPDYWSVISLLTCSSDRWRRPAQNTADYEIGKRFNICADRCSVGWPARNVPLEKAFGQGSGMEVLTTAEMQRADQLSIAAGTPGFKLMLSAAQAFTEAPNALVEQGPVLIVAGRGNNGGDGFVAAAELAAQGRE